MQKVAGIHVQLENVLECGYLIKIQSFRSFPLQTKLIFVTTDLSLSGMLTLKTRPMLIILLSIIRCD